MSDIDAAIERARVDPTWRTPSSDDPDRAFADRRLLAAEVKRLRKSHDRTHLAWMLWCYSDGYTAQDRAGMENWMTADDIDLTADDIHLKRDALAMADAILEELR